MGLAPELSLVVKHTFLEFIRTPTAPAARSRALTDTELFDVATPGPKEDAFDVEGATKMEQRFSDVTLEGASPIAGPAKSLLESWPITPLLESMNEDPQIPFAAMLPRSGCDVFDLAAEAAAADADDEAASGSADGGADECPAKSDGGMTVANVLATLAVKAILGLDGTAAESPEELYEQQQEEQEQLQNGPLKGGLPLQQVAYPMSWPFMPIDAFPDCCQSWAEISVAWHQATSSSCSGGFMDEVPTMDRNCQEETKTTVMLREMPMALTRDMLIGVLDGQGFAGCYDLVYLPVDFSSGKGLGYAFVNMVSPGDVSRLWSTLDGFRQWGLEDDKSCTISWSEPNQGLSAHVERYRNSPVMHPAVPEGWKPALFMAGLRVAFPPPTKKLKAPKFRSKKGATN